MKIAVILADNTLIVVNADDLNSLLKSKKIQSFLRSDGWVRVEFDALRSSGGYKKYDGQDRRNKANLKRSYCNHCRKEFIVEKERSVYSVIIENDGFSIQIIGGELIYGAFHYCSDTCMFHREQGFIPVNQLEVER